MIRIASIAWGMVALVATIATAGAAAEVVSEYRAMREVRMPGRLVDIGGGRRIQIDCRGAGAPTVVLESGLDHYGSLAWSSVHDSIAATTTTCAYSRPGIMWSDASSGRFDSCELAGDLHAALAAAGARAPYVMVGHSIGGPYVTTFTARYPADVAGMMLLDPSHPDQFARFRAVAGKSIMPTGTLYHVAAALAWTGALRLIPATPGFTTAQSRVDRLAARFIPQSVGAVGRETDAIPATLAAARESRALGHRPVVILTAEEGNTDASLQAMGLTKLQGRGLRAVAHALHADMATWSTRGRREVVTGAGHYIQFDRPDRVIAVVRGMIAATRNPIGKPGA
jgi:pimeloyl-ACP methyl ester carboxylesterase